MTGVGMTNRSVRRCLKMQPGILSLDRRTLSNQLLVFTSDLTSMKGRKSFTGILIIFKFLVKVSIQFN